MYTPSILKERRENVADFVNYTSNEVCIQSTITKTADALLLQSGETKRLPLNNSVKQNCNSAPISIQICHSKAFKKADDDDGTLSYGNHVKISAYSLEEVSRSLDQLDQVMASGKAMMEFLALENSRNLHVNQITGLPASAEELKGRSSSTLTKRGTYDLSEVADMVDEGFREGSSLEDRLEGISRELSGTTLENGVYPTQSKRDTYDLNDVSVKLDKGQQTGTSFDLEDLLRELGCEENGLSDAGSCSKNKRGTYDLDHVSETLDDTVSSGKCLEHSLEQMSLDDNNQSIDQCDQDKRRTYDLSDVSNRLDQSANSPSHVDESLEQSTSEHAVYEKRRTYSLSDVSNELDKSLNSGQSLDDSLELISSTCLQNSKDLKRRTYDITDVDLNLQPTNQDLLEKLRCNNNTIECTGSVQQNSGEMAAETLLTPQKVAVDTTVSKSGDVSQKRNTYTLDDVASTVDGGLSNGTDVQSSYSALSKNLTLQNGIHGKSHQKAEETILSDGVGYDKNNKKQLTPGQWIKQMKVVRNSPLKGSPEKTQNGRSSRKRNKELVSSGNGMKNAKQQKSSSVRSPKSISKRGTQSTTALKSGSTPRAKSSTSSSSTSSSSTSSLSTSDLSSRSSSELRSKSISSSPRSELKSSSTPECSSTPPSKNDVLLENLKEVSPGVRNYLTNKLGLSEKQCVAVHRRLSSGSEEPFQPPSTEHRKTYSLDDVAQSLDIATSQGLPMTKVLDNLESDTEKHCSEDGKENHEKNEGKEQHHHSISSIMEDKSNASIEQSGFEKSGSLMPVKLQSTAIQSKFSLNRRTYTLSNGSTDSRTSGKDTAPSLDNLCQLKLSTKKAVYKPSAKLHSFSHLLNGRGAQCRSRSSKGGINETKRNTYTLESVAETLEKAQDAGVPMLEALKRLSGSHAEAQSETSAQKRKTYSLEDVSNTLEGATASGVSITDALQKIADPDGAEDEKSIQRGMPLRTSKKKAPPKPKRTFQKTEIKFESDSCVIEYYTSPKKPQSTSSESDVSDSGCVIEYYTSPKKPQSTSLESDVSDSGVKETVNEIDSDGIGNIDVKEDIDGAKVPGFTQADHKNTQSSLVANGSWGHNKVEAKHTHGTCKVVDELDDLLVKLAAEVDKTKEVCSSGSEINSVDQDVTGLSMEESADNLPQVVEPVTDDGCPEGCESSVNGKGLSPDISRKSDITDLSENGTCNLLGKTDQESSEELTGVLKSDFPAQAGEIKDAISNEEEAMIEVANGCGNYKTENEDKFMPTPNSDACSDLKADEEVNCLCLQEPEESESKNEVDSADGIVEEQPQTITSDFGTILSSDGLEIAADEEPVDVADNLNERSPPDDDVNGSTVEGGTQLVDTSEGSVDSANKVDSVTREVNLLRLKLAEKQRHIEAQKQRTKEQQEEERKLFGQNVFWFAVGKEKERKINSPNETGLQTKFEPPLPNISKKTFNSSDIEPSSNDTFATFTKQSSLDEELPPSMGKLQDRTYNLQTAYGGLTRNNDDLVSPADPSEGLSKQATGKHKDTFIVPANQSLNNRNLSEQIVHEYRLSRQASGSQDRLLNTKQATSKNEALGNSSDLPTHSGRVPVMNYTSRISVPLTYTAAKPVSPNPSDGDGPGNSAWNQGDVPASFADGVSNQASSPTRKCWDIETASNGEAELAVSKSNYHIFENDSANESRTDNSENSTISPGNHHGTLTSNVDTTDIREQRQGTCGNQQDTWIDEGTTDNRQEMFGSNQDARWINEQTDAATGETSDLRKDMPTEISRVFDDESELKKVANSEKMSVHENRGTPEGQRTSPRDLETNGNSPLSDNDTPKKGLALFIGDQSFVGEDGFTPEQLKKRERFLKNRQMKIEEEKMKKEAILEKKRRKEDKMREIQLRREKEEHSRYTKLQEKKQQAEIAKHERQKYESQRKDNLQARTNVVQDGVPSGYHGLSRIETVPYGYSPVMSGVVPSGMNNGSISTPTPSAFSGFTGVQSYVKPSGKTNRKLIINAISHVCLPGAVNKETKDKCLQMMTESSAQHFLILFREGLKFRGLYSLELENKQVLKVHGVGPRSITEKMIQRLYKYNSGGKEFSEIPAKSFSLSVDGFTLQKSCWQSSKSSVASKTVSNYKSSPYRPTR